MPIELDNLEESNEFLNLIFENINSVILIADENMRITDGLIENYGADGESESKDRFHAFMENSHHLPTKDLVDRAIEDANRKEADLRLQMT